MEAFARSDVDETAPDVDDDFDLPPAETAADLPADRYFDREQSWLAFNQRVLELAEDPSIPILERAHFLAIFASNLDEFFMVRVAGLKRRIATGLAVPNVLGTAPMDVLANIAERAHELQVRHAQVYQDELKPQLAEAGVHVVSWGDLGDNERDRLTTYFADQIFPVLMPLAVDPAHPFPYISGLSLNLAVRVRNTKTGTEEFARLKMPQMLPRFVAVEKSVNHQALTFIPLEELIAQHLGDVFPGMDIIEHHAFRVTRNEDVEIDEDETENLIQVLERGLSRRRFGPPIRLEIDESMDAVTLNLLIRELDITAQEVYRLPEPLNLAGLFELASIKRPDLHFAPHVPSTNVRLAPTEAGEEMSIFRAIRRGDVLLHHPYESFSTSVQTFLEQAAVDPKVLAIKQTLYRTSGDSPIVAALIKAAESGKQVLALVEVKARFDEEANISWARKLEKAGVHVVYGLVGLKTHCKLALVIRQEDGELRHYSHVGTGNYNPKTSRSYEDLGLLTADRSVGRDLTRLFNELSGYAIEKKFKRLLVAPRYLRTGLIDAIENEARNAHAGKPAAIRIKTNSMVDEAIIDALYRASNAGVPIDIWVRGICALRPGISGLSENIRVRSVLGRYLEHSRIFMFGHNDEPIAYIGSADMMHRNLDRRVEALVKLTRPEHIDYLTSLFTLGMSDHSNTWHLDSIGEWTRPSARGDAGDFVNVQDAIMDGIQHRRKGGAS
ncbi:MAG: RNA degradosome polyphosphate kinase [Actinobacteria bacterium]|nr:RNA degradosome polyphosphate kinase [Actinomycetota bacterium]